jgi:hypothetical protein
MKREHIASRLPDTDLGRLAQALRTIAGRARQNLAPPAYPQHRSPARVAGSPAATTDQRNQHGRNETQ